MTAGLFVVIPGTLYRALMGSDHEAEIRASVAAHADLGPAYDDAVAEGLVERIGAEIDARGHLAPKARAFKETMRTHGVKHAFQQRDAAFGSGYARVNGPDPD